MAYQHLFCICSYNFQVNAIKIAKSKEKEAQNSSSNVKSNATNNFEKTNEKSLEKDFDGVSSGDAESAISQDSEDSIPIQEKSLLQKIVRTKLINNKYDLEILRKDPSSPLHSVKSFEALHLCVRTVLTAMLNIIE